MLVVLSQYELFISELRESMLPSSHCLPISGAVVLEQRQLHPTDRDLVS